MPAPDFHHAKGQYKDTGAVPAGWRRADLDVGFNTTGLFRYCRHPNFAAEQAVWLALFEWSCRAARADEWANWTVVAPAAYLALFQASTWLTELLTARKYPVYREYQRGVSMFVFSPFSRWDSEAALEAVGKKGQ